MAGKQKNIKILYQVDTSQVKAAEATVTKAKAATDQLNKSTKQLADQGKQSNAQFKASIGTVIDEMTRLRSSMENLPRHHTQQLEQMKARYRELKKEVEAFNKSVGEGGGNALQGLTTSLGQVYNAVRLALTAGLIKETANAVIQMTALAGKVEGVKIAFNRLPNSTMLMEQLRKSTHGTLTDLELMQRALQARNFQIPLENMSKLLEFAAIRAQQTGQSVDYLVESIVLGLGYNSIRRLDNVGLSVEKLKLRMAETGQTLREAFGEFIDEELVKMGSLVETGAVKVERLSAAWKELGAVMAKQNQQSGFVQWLTGLVKVETALMDPAEAKRQKAIADAVVEVENFNKANKEALKNKEEGIRLIELEIDRLKNLHLQNSIVQKSGGAPNFLNPIPSPAFAAAFQQNAVIKEQIKILEDREKQLRKGEEVEKDNTVTIKTLNEQIEKYNEQLTESVSIHDTKKIESLLKLKAQTEAYRDALLNLNKVQTDSEAEPLPKVELTGDLAVTKIDYNELLVKNTEETWEELERIREQGLKDEHDLDVKDIKDKEKWAKERERIMDGLTNLAINSARDILSAWNHAQESQEERTLASLERQLDAFNDYSDRVMKTAGDNERRKLELEITTADERKKLEAKIEQEKIAADKREAEREKKERLRQIAIDTAAGIVRALTIAPGIGRGGGLAAGILAAEAIIQAGIVNKYKDGVIDLQGPGTETSDSIPALLSRRESVMTAAETKNSMGILKDIRAKRLDDKIFDKIVQSNPAADIGPIVNRLDSVVKAVERNKPSDSIREGFFAYEVKEVQKGLRKKIRKAYFG